MNVLIVDDDRTNLALFAHMLRGIPEMKSIEFSDPVQALTWCSSHQTDLLLLDYMMPKMNGFAFLEEFRTLTGPDHVPVIMITADAKKQIKHEALELSANDFLTKPVNKAELRARVSNMLSLRQSQLRQAERARNLSDEVDIINAQLKANEQSVAALLTTVASFRDVETGAHLQRMSRYARLLAENLHLSVKEQNDIFEAAPLHDIGKIGIPDHILLKPGRLTDEEMVIMRTHPIIGAKILGGGTSQLMRNAAVVAMSHHERFDGTGYPQGLVGNNIPLYARIVTVADVFDALTSGRPYKTAWSFEQASEWLLENAGTHFDPDCVTAFLQDKDKIMKIFNAYQEKIN